MILAVYARVELLQKPSWLEDYRKKYGTSYDDHVTLKQPVQIAEDQSHEARRRLARVLAIGRSSGRKIRLVFDHLVADEKGGSLLLMAQQNQEIIDLQHTVIASLNAYDRYLSPELRTYEERFEPHLTIAFSLGDRYEQAVRDLREDLVCVGEISEVVLSCVERISVDEAKNPMNQTVYRI